VYLHWQHSLSARVARRRYQWAWRSAVVRRNLRREETEKEKDAVAEGIDSSPHAKPGNPAAGGIEVQLQGDPDKLKLELQLFNASGLTDRSGGGSFASHDAATDTGRMPALTQTL
jgi:hypothetical protein